VTAVAVLAGKAAPGATTVAAALTLSWPGPVILVDADPAGGDVMAGLLPGRASTESGLLSWSVAGRHLPAMEATPVCQGVVRQPTSSVVCQVRRGER